MTPAPIPPNDAARLKALHRYAVLDTPPEAIFDRLTHLATCLFETPIALVSLIDHKRQWFKPGDGLAPVESDREVAFCAHTILSDDVLVVPETLEDARFHDNPQVIDAPFIRFYAGAPLITTVAEAMDGHGRREERSGPRQHLLDRTARGGRSAGPCARRRR